ncbi:GNAT family N-acetyltransferase [Winogradskyella undariae]|uniref:GNAT family N-acetyltransferase n=1 Tax=Winogradskyella TaxID=286104 RepID=UPI00156B1FC5|nr:MULTISPECIES: GNAT family N-acetyltransferase [Winogradskyella]NRR92319.1 GNAT family N-acetyltransferase [Winogradskyella undariae]QNK78627.1 GNAT family N-acetyltransferase [Winogradskyella sp. PAMC22761]QXP78348.1 GNAT family N-acetyltransferase [Winogradskyella sp. HaHa_3_26]
MVSLKGTDIYLRALEPEDLDFVYNIENNTALWSLSDTQTPYSRFLIKQYLENAQQDIFEAKQLRLAICDHKHNTIGLIDVFDFDIKNKRAGIGILIQDKENRNQGYGKEALKLLVDYCFQTLHLHQVYANISENNLASLNLFEGNGFKIIGLKKDWSFDGENYTNEYILQQINN